MEGAHPSPPSYSDSIECFHVLCTALSTRGGKRFWCSWSLENSGFRHGRGVALRLRARPVSRRTSLLCLYKGCQDHRLSPRPRFLRYREETYREREREGEMATLTVPHPVPSPAEDAENLRKAFQGWGTDEKAVIAILAHRDADQRQQISLAYEELYNENLIKRLEKELTGDLERAVYRWMFQPIERQAILINVAVKKDFDYRVIIETGCVNSPNELLAVKQAYQARYKLSLEEDVAAHTTGDFRKLLFALVSTYRYDGPEVNISLAQSEAKILADTIQQKAFDHEEIIRILSTRSKAQLNATFNCYKDEFGTSITKGLTSETPNEFVSALRVAIRCIISPQKYFEKLLRNALNKKGTDEDVLSRVVVTRAEKDLKDIKEMYHQRTNVPLEHAVGKETSGHYKGFLLSLIEN